jgi:hypothetical protein
MGLVEKLRADDGYARSLANNSLDFARTYLNRGVMLAFTRQLLVAYHDLFSDMGEYMETVGDPGDSRLFKAQANHWEQDWRSVQVPLA